MPIHAYKEKRNFRRTPEPSGSEKKKSPPELRFVVQRHQASRLHYDFRLELDGTLKSWAVPKGPSMDPGVKRLAMKVEDHPVDYLTFEGTIPPGNYGAGEVVVWDIGFYHSSESLDPEENVRDLRAGLEKGHLDFVLLGKRLKGRFSLVKLRKDPEDNAWLLIKQRDQYASHKDLTRETDSVLSQSPFNDGEDIRDPRRASEGTGNVRRHDPFPHDIKPMRAELADHPFDRVGWLFEIKWDGYRAIAEIDPPRLRLYSRNGLPFEETYPSIVKGLGVFKKQAVLDGEIVALKDGKPDFHTLQDYEKNKAPLQYALFDLLYFDGEDLRRKPLIERKALLKSILPEDPCLLFSDHVAAEGIAFFEQIKKQGLEGMVGKDQKSAYQENRRSRAWLKIKYQNEQEAIIVGFTRPKGSRKYFGALVLAVYDSGSLKYIGHSGGGFTEQELERIFNLLDKIKMKASPLKEKVRMPSAITWAEPKYVCQIRFAEWTPDGQIRQPVYLGLRPDKDAREVTRER